MKGIGEDEFQRKAEERGYETIRFGCLDFLVYSSKDADHDKAFVVEVKSENGKLKTKQRKAIKILRTVGIPAFVSREGEWVEPKEVNQTGVSMAAAELVDEQRSKTVKVQKVKTRTVNGKDYFKYQLTIPKKFVEGMGWEDVDELKLLEKDSGIEIVPKEEEEDDEGE